MKLNKFLIPLLLLTFIQAGGAWADVLHRDADFGSFVRLKNRVEATGVQPSVFHPPPASTKGFYILQFNGPVEESWKKKISSLGVRFLGYIPDNAFIVKVPQRSFSAVQSDPNVKWIGEYQPDDKTDRKIAADILSGQTAVKKFVVKVFDGEDMSPIINSIQSLGGEVEVVSNEDALNGKILNVTIDEAATKDITSIPSVEFVEEKPIPVLYNNVAVQPTQMNVTPVWNLPVPLTGTGQVVGILDTGIDTGNTSTIHPAFYGNVSNGQPKIMHVFTYGRTGDWSDPDGHGTHTSGSLAGMAPPPLQTYSIKGVAYDAQIVIQSALTSSGGLNIPYLDSTTPGAAPFLDPYNQGVRVHSNSWGETDSKGNPLPGQYTSNSLGADTFAWNHKKFLAVFAAGNDGKDANGNGIVDLGSIDPPATAKNVLAVGASENNRPTLAGTYNSMFNGFLADPIKSDRVANNPNGMVAFSSRGPTLDGRIKPDVVAPGTWILSTRSTLIPTSSVYSHYWAKPSDMGLPAAMDSYFAFDGGTSMACPLTAGAAAIVRQYYTDTQGVADPSAALIKATIINGATNMYPGQYAAPYNDVTGWPDNNQGFGRVNLARSVTPASSLDYVDDNTGLTTSGNDTYAFSVVDISAPVRVTLVWTDHPATAGASTQLVNDLDLEVTAPNGFDIYHGNISGINPVNFDHLNNVEAVEIPVSGLTSGIFTVTVIGDNVPQGPQPYALAIRNGKNATISPSNASYDTTGTISGSISVTATGPWTATSNDPSWITITSGDSGTGFGTVNYSVAPFTGSGTRTGSITVAGSTFTITQTGVQNLTISVSPGGGGTTNYSSGQYDYNSTLSLQATPNTGYVFSGWTVNGTPAGSTNPLALKMDSDKIVVANFVMQGIVLGYKQNFSTVTLTATMYYNGQLASGKNITFYDKLSTSSSFASKGSATTGSPTSLSPGVAVKTFTAVVGSHTAYAKFNTSGGIPTMQSTPNLSYAMIGTVALTSPLNASTVTAPITLTWQPLTGAGSYHIQVSTSSKFGTGTLAYTTANTPYGLDTSVLIPGKTYYWRVYADILPTGTSMYSTTWKFIYKKAAILSLAYGGISGSTVTLRATLTEADGITLIGGKSITFYENTNGGLFSSKGTASTGSLTSISPGVATKSWTTAVGNHNAYAKFGGDSMHAPVSTNPADVSYSR